MSETSQARKQVEVRASADLCDLAFAKRALILPVPEAAQPSPDIHKRSPLVRAYDGPWEIACPVHWPGMSGLDQSGNVGISTWRLLCSDQWASLQFRSQATFRSFYTSMCTTS